MSPKPGSREKGISIVLCGAAGLGIQTVEHFLTHVLRLSGLNVFATKEYMSRIRGGQNSTEIRVSRDRVNAFVDRMDIMVPLDGGSIDHLRGRISPGTVILGDRKVLGEDVDKTGAVFVDLPLFEMAAAAGGDIYAATVAAGAVAAQFMVKPSGLESYLRDRFASKGESVIGKNIEAVRMGYEAGSAILESGKIKVNVGEGAAPDEEVLVNGAEAVGLGAIAGGCNFVSSYPMSPSTSVLVFMAGRAAESGIIVEQAEDEIAAMNMAAGAWYAGARGMVTTSGGGFALMTEGLSLVGMLESPMVVHLAQRPGPATGLPTRTEQGDLQLALYGGHGEFPRVILAPGTIEDAYHLTRRAFDLADKYQVPVIILTDQHLMDSYYNVPPFHPPDVLAKSHVIRTDRDYKRYRITENGISPRGVPGYGEGFVVVDSDEHDEEGHITEDLDMRTRMVDKRLRKGEILKEESIPPDLVGGEDYRTLVIGWGSTRHALEEALETIGGEDIALLHFKQVHPLHSSTLDYLKRADKTIIVENNATSQFGQLLRLSFGLGPDSKILKYNGMPFSVEELAEKIKAAGI